MTINTRAQHDLLRLLELTKALSEGVAGLTYQTDKTRMLEYVREIQDLIVMSPACTQPAASTHTEALCIDWSRVAGAESFPYEIRDE
jgi:hypothetical protein